jgi:hypothetical protein
MKINKNIISLDYPWGKFVHYIFDELQGDEIAAIEDMIAEDDAYSKQVSELIEYCRIHKIFTSAQMQEHLQWRQHEVFHKLIEKGENLSGELKRKYEHKLITEPKPQSSLNQKIPTGSNRKKWIIWVVGLGMLSFGLFQIIDIPSPSVLPPKINNSQSENNSNEQKEIEEGDVQDSEKFDNTLPSKKVSPTIEKEKNITPPKNEDEIEKPIAGIKVEKFYDAWEKNYGGKKVFNQIRTGGQSDNDINRRAQALLKNYKENNTLTISEYMYVGKYFLGEEQYAQAIEFFLKVPEVREPEKNWFLMQAYIFQKNESSLKKAQQLFQEKIVNNTKPRIIRYVAEMPKDLREFLS